MRDTEGRPQPANTTLEEGGTIAQENEHMRETLTNSYHPALHEHFIPELTARFDKAGADIRRNASHPLALRRNCQRAHRIRQGENNATM